MPSRIDEFLEIVRRPDGPLLQGTHPSDGALQALFVQVICSDGAVTDEELRLALRLFPGSTLQEGAANLRKAQARPFDLDALTDALPDLEDRRKLLQFVQHVAASDSWVQDEEKAWIVALRRSLSR
jgi:hypothetical protein